MATRISKIFNQELNKLFKYRTHWLRLIVDKPKPGKPPKLTKKKLDKSINALQELSNDSLIKEYYKREFIENGVHKKQWHTSNKGWGVNSKRNAFKRWYENNINWSNNIYIFWSGKKCVYVGRTLNGKGRPQSHFEKYWFGRITRVDIYSTASKRNIPKLECLAIHKWKPTENNNKPSIPKKYSKCTICDNSKLIKQELKSIFKLR